MSFSSNCMEQSKLHIDEEINAFCSIQANDTLEIVAIGRASPITHLEVDVYAKLTLQRRECILYASTVGSVLRRACVMLLRVFNRRPQYALRHLED